jgi:hypothetical protein
MTQRLHISPTWVEKDILRPKRKREAGEEATPVKSPVEGREKRKCNALPEEHVPIRVPIWNREKRQKQTGNCAPYRQRLVWLPMGGGEPHPFNCCSVVRLFFRRVGTLHCP